MEWEDGVGDDFDNTFPDYQDENENPKVLYLYFFLSTLCIDNIL